VPRDPPVRGDQGSDNIIAFTTNRYAPAAHRADWRHADVTAMGIFSDIFKLLHYRRTRD
jgi:homoserine dehydrogenase